MEQALETLLVDIDRLCAQYNQVNAADSTVEETELKHQQLKKSTESILKRIESIVENWPKQQNSVMERLLDAVTKLTECDDKIFQPKDSSRLNAIRDGIKRKISWLSEKGNQGKMQAHVTVNVNIDRNLLAAKNGRGKRATAKKFSRSQSVNSLHAKTGRFKSKAGKPRKVPSTTSISDLAEREDLPDNEEDRSTKVWVSASTGTSRTLSSAVQSSDNSRAEREKLPLEEDPSTKVWLGGTASAASQKASSNGKPRKLPSMEEDQGRSPLKHVPTTSSASEDTQSEREILPNVDEEDRSANIWLGPGANPGQNVSKSEDTQSEREMLPDEAEQDRSTRVWLVPEPNPGQKVHRAFPLSDDTRSEREQLPDVAEEDRSTRIWLPVSNGPMVANASFSDERNLKSICSNTEGVPMAPDEKTSRIWMKDDNEDKGGVEPNLQWKSTNRQVVTIIPPSNTTAKDSAESSGSIPLGFNIRVPVKLFESSMKPAEKQESMKTSKSVQGGLDSSGNKGQGFTRSSVIWMALLAVVVIVFSPFLRRFVCCLVATWTQTSSRMSMILGELWCAFSNSMCESYGAMCSHYCASGLQRDIWKSCRH